MTKKKMTFSVRIKRVRKLRKTKKFKNRFQKFYHKHKKQLNAKRRALYKSKKKKGICVKCKKKAIKGSVFCANHKLKSRRR